MSKRKRGSLGSGALERLSIVKAKPVSKATRNVVDFSTPPKKRKTRMYKSLLTTNPIGENPTRRLVTKEDELARKAREEKIRKNPSKITLVEE
jgi:hypothetical protein